jgi:stage II sporulation protein D
MLACTGVPFLVPNPPAGKKNSAAAEKKPEPKVTPAPVTQTQVQAPTSDDTIDFAAAFAPDTGSERLQWNVEGVSATPAPAAASAYRAIIVPGNTVRVALRRNVSRAVVHTGDTVEVRSSSLAAPARCTGRLLVETKAAGLVTISVNDGPRHEVALPCTLSAVHQSNIFDLGEERYRGSLIITGREFITFVNYIPVEVYLRGVLPLEMGKRGWVEAEALKAQAVAARTYAYRHIADNRGDQPFDVVRTVADQVYGGADAETAETDSAVTATAGIVLAWHGALADAYYHSTCGGATAGVDEAWGKPGREYLSSRSDLAPDGRAYCSISPSFSWEESWDAQDLSKILQATVHQAVPGGRFDGKLKEIVVDERFGSGRIKSCRLVGSGGSVECGGDKLRSVLRRKTATGDILRSANFTVVKNGPHTFTLRGTGYGHGVGMCQMGAIGRARQGQDFEQILRAYFTGIELCRVQ